MAQKASKARARSNAQALQNMHLGSLAVNSVFLLWHFLISPRSLLAYSLLSFPAFLCQFILERVGRPKHDAHTGALVSAGDDLNSPGMTEYMFDCVWLTWGSAVLVLLVGNWGWLLWGLIPTFALYKASALLEIARAMAGLGGGGGGGGDGRMPQVHGTDGSAAGGHRKQRRKA